MSIQKKSLINTLKTTKKANIVKEDVSLSGATASPMQKVAGLKRAATTRNLTVRYLAKK